MTTIPDNNASYLIPTYARQPIEFVRGQGSWLYTADGTAYLDALTGIAVCGLGHSHPQIASAISKQANTLVHTSNLFAIPEQEQAGQLLCTAAGMEKVFFANSGAEANEAALKLARLHATARGLDQPKVIVMNQSFHGRTYLTLSATGNPKVKTGFYPLSADFIHVPLGDIEAIKAHANDPSVCAIMLEPIQGEGGVNVVDNSSSYLSQIRTLCDQHDWLMILDEIQTGNGRTGKYFAYQHSNIQPDVLTTAKGLGNGFPVGACMVSGKANGLFGYGSHGSTYGGSQLASRVVSRVYQLLQQDNGQVMTNATTQGQYMQDELATALSSKGVTVRGQGMMFALVLPEDDSRDYSQLVHQAREEQQLIINVTGVNKIRLLPPLNLSRDEADQVVDRLATLLNHHL